MYQLAPFIGFPRTLIAVATINEVFQGQGIELPLPAQGTVSDADRYSRLAEQAPLRGRDQGQLGRPAEPFDEALPRFLTEFGFGDFYTRTGLTLAERELLVLCALATIGDTSAQLDPHGRACLQVGNSKTAVVAALVHCFPHRIPARRRCHPCGQEPQQQQYNGTCLSICLTTRLEISPQRRTVLDNPKALPIDHAPAKPT